MPIMMKIIFPRVSQTSTWCGGLPHPESRCVGSEGSITGKSQQAPSAKTSPNACARCDAPQGQLQRSRNMRHEVYTYVTTYDADNNIIRDRIGIGGKQRVSRSRVEIGVDAGNLKDAKIVVDVSVTKGLCSITVQKPVEFDVAVTDAKQPTSRKE